MSDTPSSDAADRAARILAQALIEAEVIIAAERDSRPPAVSPQVLEALERFGSVLTQLVEHTEHLAQRVAILSDTVATLAEQQAQAAILAPAAKPQLPEMEPSFAPGGEGIDVTIADVPGFQGLMEIQRALVRLPQVQSAAVRRYQDDEAAIQLVLSQPMTAAAIAEGAANGTGRTIVVDEARTEALRLRLRFLPG
jgi:ABC-type transporter Mla subunit MlaD